MVDVETCLKNLFFFFETVMNQRDRVDTMPPISKLVTTIERLHHLFSDRYDGIHFDNAESRRVSMVADLVDFINTHLSEDLSLERLASEVNYSEYYICRIFKSITNYTLTNYIIEKRISKAAYYLKGDLPIGKVAENAGFNEL